MWFNSFLYPMSGNRLLTNDVVTVRETCRKQGYGEALIDAAVQQIRDRRLQCVNLHVDPARSAAVALYKKKGFYVETTIKSYYAADRDAYRMVLQLISPENQWVRCSGKSYSFLYTAEKMHQISASFIILLTMVSQALDFAPVEVLLCVLMPQLEKCPMYHL